MNNRKYSFFISILFVILVVCGCAATEETVEEKVSERESQKFESNSYSMIGVENKIGFIYDEYSTPFIVDEGQKYMWHFWGDDVVDQPFTVIGKNMKSGEEVVVIDNEIIAGPLNGADAHMPSSMSLPTQGKWALMAYVDEELFGTIAVDVR
ncbi:hypothetical protein [Alkalihalobacterium bogoriense]|uniref:hypothetical protein n=1 Tax=Alkalihalobacterium bogoriense TaxID=246272 RepID=UPI0005582EE8|nr:hypothetical protein [Alkalihalobacterium bogoriense]